MKGSKDNGHPANRIVRVAATHTASAFLDKSAGVEKACEQIARAGQEGVQFLVFPESFIPGFPLWSALVRPIDAHSWFGALAANALRADGPELSTIADAAAQHGVIVSIGFTELSPVSAGAMWNSMATIGADGKILNLHRKLVPTFYEKLTWNPGDAAGLRVMDTPIGRIGGLICGENGNPLSRYTLMAQGEEIHAASYPPVWPFRNPLFGQPYDLADAIRVRAAAHSFEAKVYTVVSAGVLDDATFAKLSDGDHESERILSACPRSSSMVIGPNGETIGTPRTEEEGLVIADIDLAPLVELKQHHDMAGYYNRMDIHRLHVNARRPHPVYFDTDRSSKTTVGEADDELDAPTYSAIA